MKVFALAVFLVLSAGYVLSAARSLPQASPEKNGSLTTEQLARARALFDGKCARCHGADGEGQTVLGDMLDVPDFTNAKWWKDHGNADDLIKSITEGKDDMPTFGKKLTKPEIALLADYVRLFNKAAR